MLYFGLIALVFFLDAGLAILVRLTAKVGLEVLEYLSPFGSGPALLGVGLRGVIEGGRGLAKDVVGEDGDGLEGVGSEGVGGRGLIGDAERG